MFHLSHGYKCKDGAMLGQNIVFRDVLLSNQIYRKQIIRATTIEFKTVGSSSKNSDNFYNDSPDNK